MEKIRCAWCLSDPIYIEYHDNEDLQATGLVNNHIASCGARKKIS